MKDIAISKNGDYLSLIYNGLKSKLIGECNEGYHLSDHFKKATGFTPSYFKN